MTSPSSFVPAVTPSGLALTGFPFLLGVGVGGLRLRLAHGVTLSSEKANRPTRPTVGIAGRSSDRISRSEGQDALDGLLGGGEIGDNVDLVGDVRDAQQTSGPPGSRRRSPA